MATRQNSLLLKACTLPRLANPCFPEDRAASVTQSPIRMMTWGARVLYLGPAFKLSAHRNIVGVLCVCLDGDMDILAGAALAEDRPVACRSVYVPPGTRHLIRFRANRIACLYVDRESEDPSRLMSAMIPVADGLSINHTHHDEIVGVLRAVADGRIPREERNARVAAAYGLINTGETRGDDRIAAAIHAILEDPSQPHRAETLAARVGLSASRFRHAFRAATGVPLKRYRLWVRVGAAMKAVHAGANLTAAAHEAGFSSSAHFSTAYRAMFGMTPSAFVAIAQSFVTTPGETAEGAQDEGPAPQRTGAGGAR